MQENNTVIDKIWAIAEEAVEIFVGYLPDGRDFVTSIVTIFLCFASQFML